MDDPEQAKIKAWWFDRMSELAAANMNAENNLRTLAAALAEKEARIVELEKATAPAGNTGSQSTI